MPERSIALIVRQTGTCPLLRAEDRWTFTGREISKAPGVRLCATALCYVYPKLNDLLRTLTHDSQLPDDYLLCDANGCDAAFGMQFSSTGAPGDSSEPIGTTRRLERSNTSSLTKVAPLPFLSRLPKDLAAELIEACKTVYYDDGQIILMQGVVGQHLYIMSEGFAEVSRRGENKDETVLATLGQGQCFGEMSILSGENTSAEVRSKGRSAVLTLHREQLEILLLKSPAISREFSKLLAERLKATNMSLESELSRGILGKLSLISLVDLVQTLNQSRRTGTLMLKHGSEHAEIGFRDGALYSANSGELKGDEAFFKVMCWPDGDFGFEQIEPAMDDPGRTESDTMGLMMEGMRRLDEMKSAAKLLRESMLRADDLKAADTRFTRRGADEPHAQGEPGNIDREQPRQAAETQRPAMEAEAARPVEESPRKSEEEHANAEAIRLAKEAEAAARAAEEAQRVAEEKRASAEAAARAAEEAQRKAEEEHARAEAKRLADEAEAAARAAEEAQRKAEEERVRAEAKRLADEADAAARAAEEAQRKAEEERACAEAKRVAEEAEAAARAAEEAQRKAEEERARAEAKRLADEAEAAARAAEEAQRIAEEERARAEAKRLADEAEAAARAAEEAQRKAEEERARAEAKRVAEEAEAAARAADEARRKAAQEAYEKRVAVAKRLTEAVEAAIRLADEARREADEAEAALWSEEARHEAAEKARAKKLADEAEAEDRHAEEARRKAEEAEKEGRARQAPAQPESELAISFMNEAVTALNLGKDGSAVLLYSQAIEIFERLFNSGREDLVNEMIKAFKNKIHIVKNGGNPQIAVQLCDRAIVVIEQKVNAVKRRELTADLAEFMALRAISRAKAGDTIQARTEARKAISMLKEEVTVGGRPDLKVTLETIRKNLRDLL